MKQTATSAHIASRKPSMNRHRSTLRLWTHKPAKKIALKRKPTFPKREPNSRKRGPFLRRVFLRAPMDGVILRKPAPHRRKRFHAIRFASDYDGGRFGFARSPGRGRDGCRKTQGGPEGLRDGGGLRRSQIRRAHYPCGPDSGKKNVRTDEPTEHVDTKILETLLELNAGEKLPLGLRVESYVVLNR